MCGTEGVSENRALYASHLCAPISISWPLSLVTAILFPFPLFLTGTLGMLLA